MGAPAASLSLDRELTHFGEELRSFLERLPREVRRERSPETIEQCNRLLERLPSVGQGERWSAAWGRVGATLAELRAALDQGAARAYVLHRWEEAARAYEHWLGSFKAGSGTARSALRSLKPLVPARTAFHVVSGVVGTVLYQFFLTRGQAIAALLGLLALAVSFELAKRGSQRWNQILVGRLFHSMARPGEYRRTSSATWYVVAFCLLVPLFSREAVLTGGLILAFGDPAAAWFGRRYGRLKLKGNKSLAGTCAFAAVGTLVAFAFLLLYPELPLARRLVAALAAAAVGAAVELFSTRIDDNLTIPAASVLTASIFL